MRSSLSNSWRFVSQRIDLKIKERTQKSYQQMKKNDVCTSQVCGDQNRAESRANIDLKFVRWPETGLDMKGSAGNDKNFICHCALWLCC